MFEWMDRAKCRNDQALQEWTKDTKRDFFHDKKYEKAAKEYCKSCPVLDECLALANSELSGPLSANSNYSMYQGVMGGQSLRERRKNYRKTLRKIEELKKRWMGLSQDGTKDSTAA